MITKWSVARQRLFVEPFVKFVFRVRGVRFASGVNVRGVPIVSRAPGSSIHVGPRVTLVSSPLWTALGVRQPTILRTLRRGASIEIGQDTGMSGAVVCAARSVRIGERVLIGANVTIVDTDFHPIAPEGRYVAPIPLGSPEDEVVIEDDVFIGTGALILKGVTIGQGAVVGAGAVVTRDVAPRHLVAGNPARPIGAV